jgi:hypothetical protein
MGACAIGSILRFFLKTGRRLRIRWLGRLSGRLTAGSLLSAVMEAQEIDLSGSPAQTICDISALAVGGSWNRDGVIIYGDYGGSQVSCEYLPAAVVPNGADKPGAGGNDSYAPCIFARRPPFPVFRGAVLTTPRFISARWTPNPKNKAGRGCWVPHPEQFYVPRRTGDRDSCSSFEPDSDVAIL